MAQVVVLGAGIIGLPTALAIQKRSPHVQVTLIADKFSPDLTSDVAAGLIWPYCTEESEERILRWTQATIDKIKEYMSERPGEGAETMSGYAMNNYVASEDPFWKPLTLNFRRIGPDEIGQFSSNPEHRSGYFFTTWYLESSKYLVHCLKSFLANGGVVKNQHVSRLSDISCDVLVNCTGLQAHHVAGDEQVFPVRGQVIRVKCPAVKHFFIDKDYYALLNDDVIILGGTTDKDAWTTEFNSATAQRILEGNCKNVPTLRSAKIVSHHVGLRPGRKNICLKHEKIQKPDGSFLDVVHNYGHGGSGVTLHWGCALDAAELVAARLSPSKI